MSERAEQIRLQDGTLVRHKAIGYEGRIEGTTEIKACFTAAGKLLESSTTKQKSQYRVAVQGESMRRIAPAEDLEILEGITRIVCAGCEFSFWTRPGLIGKQGGRCQCGGWICPSCLTCQNGGKQTGKSGPSPCDQEGKRVARKRAARTKAGAD